MLLGMEVQIAPDRPNYTLPDDLPLPKAFREEFASWSLKYCGYTNVVADGHVYRISANPCLAITADRLIMNPRTFAKAMEDANYAEIDRTY